MHGDEEFYCRVSLYYAGRAVWTEGVCNMLMKQLQRSIVNLYIELVGSCFESISHLISSHNTIQYNQQSIEHSITSIFSYLTAIHYNG